MKNRVFEYMVSMPDGVELYTVVILPEKGNKFPVILVRTPYSKERSNIAGLQELDTHGYARVHQHCRGCGLSNGICVPYINERNDGLAMLDWVRKQDFYNGEIYLDGSSYLSSVHFSYMNCDLPDVKGAFLAVQDSQRYNIIYRNGFFKPGLHGSWAVSMYKKNLQIERNIQNETWLTRPLFGITETIFNERNEQLEEELLHPDPDDPFWQTPAGGADYSHAVNHAAFPVLLATAASDIYCGGVLDMWNAIPEEKRKKSAMIVTPFAHEFDTAYTGELPEFPGGRISENLPDYIYCWFDYCRTGKQPDFIQLGKVLYYPLFENRWYHADKFPEAEGKKSFFFTEERTLSENPPSLSGKITYCYNPAAPASFKGGCCHNFDGMQIQDEPNSRYDIISFVSEPLEETDCAGTIKLKLPVKITAEDSCFYARIDIIHDGKALSLRDEIDSVCRQFPDYQAENKVVMELSFVPIAFRICKGDRIRVDISSSCFPYFQTHPNCKGLMAKQERTYVSRNTIFMQGAELILPVKEK